MALLEVSDVHVHYDSIRALKGLSFEVMEREIVTLVGANGAGKSTTINAISGLLPLHAGAIRFADEDLGPLLPHQVIERGIVQVREGRRIFGRLTVKENLELGAYSRRDGAKAVARDMERSFQLFPRLSERLHQVAGTLSGGEQQMLAIARALMARPRLLLLDEPSMGIAPVLVDRIFEVIRELNRDGMTIVLVEQNAIMALDVCDRGYVLESGRIVLSGRGCDLLDNDEVARAYLG